ncbi:MerR family transcriptional regulator [uncultured Vagococcus sp.]|uniref:MerR family transcriptional regulator n=1 Tax=uncultured Vagococcus sp. TaxID=189676 RepID=UPI0028D02393|nr:MerR family transcriptional regulator [uncultured Vagococcus sp.]
MNSKEVSELFGISKDTIRYYERVGVIPPISRDHNGYRVFKTKDLNWIFLVKSLRNAGLSIDSLIEFAALSQMEGDVRSHQKQILKNQLEEVEAKLAQMNKVRELLVYKIETYDEHIAQFQSGELTDNKVEELWKKIFIEKK